ncbi:MAG: hypothetical protein KA371_04450 [Acidobacteria bacterium]|nr:hypothetical protein [Acidobacteriota bacterium]
MRISNRKALGSGLTCRPLLTTARDTLVWRQSDDVPEALRTRPRYVRTEERERQIPAARKVTSALASLL